jgi:hypothetical protein
VTAALKVLGRLFGYATLGAGIVGIVRQRREALAVRRGELTPAAAASEVAPRARYGPLAARLATWVPERPRTPHGRLLATVWAGPLTAVGLVLALAAGRKPYWDEASGCLITPEVGGPSRLVLSAIGAQANAVGQVVLSKGPRPSALLLAHEAVHVRQAERLGPLLFPLYVWLTARYGYRDHPLERAARLGAQRTRHDVSGGG